MNIIKKVLPFLGLVLSVLLIVSFKTIPSAQLWNGYKLLYVSNNTSISQTESILEKCGIDEYVCVNNQRAPIMLRPDSVEAAMFRINMNTIDNQYLIDRQSYFFDSSRQYNIFYIPENYLDKLGDVLHFMNKQNIKCGIDSTFSYLWLLPAIVTLFSIILLMFCKHKLFYFFGSIIPCIYVFCNAFYSSAVAVIILLLIIFFISNIYVRKGSFTKIITNYFIDFSFIASIFISFSTSFNCGIFFSVSIIGAASFILIYINFKNFSLRKSSFTPVLIRKAKNISIYGNKINLIMPFALLSVVIIFAYFLLSSSASIKTNNDSSVLLPGNAAEKSSSLPEFEDFYRWNWNILTYPFRSLNQTSNNANFVEYPRFVSENGIIKQVNETLYYDDLFKSEVYEGIDFLDFNAIEKVIKLQGLDFIPGYVNSSTYNISMFSIIMMIFGFFVLLFIYFSAIISKGGRK